MVVMETATAAVPAESRFDQSHSPLANEELSDAYFKHGHQHNPYFSTYYGMSHGKSESCLLITSASYNKTFKMPAARDSQMMGHHGFYSSLHPSMWSNPAASAKYYQCSNASTGFVYPDKPVKAEQSPVHQHQEVQDYNSVGSQEPSQELHVTSASTPTSVGSPTGHGHYTEAGLHQHTVSQQQQLEPHQLLSKPRPQEGSAFESNNNHLQPTSTSISTSTPYPYFPTPTSSDLSLYGSFSSSSSTQSSGFLSPKSGLQQTNNTKSKSKSKSNAGKSNSNLVCNTITVVVF